MRDPNSSIPENVEILAACAWDARTTLPGDHSFTIAFIKAVEDELRYKNGSHVGLAAVFRRLSLKSYGLPVQPVHATLNNGNGCIKLEPLGSNFPMLQKETLWLNIQLAISGGLTNDLINELVRWWTNGPSVVSNVVLDCIKDSDECSAADLTRQSLVVAMGHTAIKDYPKIREYCL